MRPVIHPRRGDVEDDASSTKRRSLLSLAGSLLAEISFPKLVLAWMLLLVVPALMLGLAPIVASAWVSKVWGKITAPLVGFWPLLLLAVVIALAWIGGGPLFRMVEAQLLVPELARCRACLRHLSRRAAAPR